MKSYTYQHGSDFRTLTEDDIRVIVNAEDRSSAEKANARKILALQINDSYTTTGGTTFTRVADDTAPSRAIVCHGLGTSSRKCDVCGAKVPGHGRLCDGPGKTGTNATETCDTFMCPNCAKRVGNNRDLCPACVERGAA